jgi:hypothetical protein
MRKAVAKQPTGSGAVASAAEVDGGEGVAVGDDDQPTIDLTGGGAIPDESM